MAMKGAPSKSEMMNPTNAQGGKPNYVDKTAETPGSPFHANQGDEDAPDYIANNPRYWEYR